MTIIDDISQIELGIESLLNGQLTPRLIKYDQIMRMLRRASTELSQTGLELCLQTALVDGISSSQLSPH